MEGSLEAFQLGEGGEVLIVESQRKAATMDRQWKLKVRQWELKATGRGEGGEGDR